MKQLIFFFLFLPAIGFCQQREIILIQPVKIFVKDSLGRDSAVWFAEVIERTYLEAPDSISVINYRRRLVREQIAQLQAQKERLEQQAAQTDSLIALLNRESGETTQDLFDSTIVNRASGNWVLTFEKKEYEVRLKKDGVIEFNKKDVGKWRIYSEESIEIIIPTLEIESELKFMKKFGFKSVNKDRVTLTKPK